MKRKFESEDKSPSKPNKTRITNSPLKLFYEEEKLVEDFNRFTISKFLYKQREHNSTGLTYEIRNEKSFESAKLTLRDLWAHTPELKPGTVINICRTSKDENDHYVVERNQGYLIVEPDKLISVTNVVGMSWCERKIAFSEHFRFPVDNIDTLRGNLAHDLICQVIMKEIEQVADIVKEVDMLLKNPETLEKAYGLGLTQSAFVKLGHELANPVAEFMKGKMDKFAGNKMKNGEKLKISELKDIEDCYWSPEYGLKGKVDCTVEAINLQRHKSVIPVEFKTGKTQTKGTPVRSEHLGQVYLYSLMMGILTDPVGPTGMLHYIRNVHTEETNATVKELQSLIMARNRIIMNIMENNSNSIAFDGLPKPCNVDFDRQCRNCEYKNICALSLKTSSRESTEPPTSAEIKLVDSLNYLTSEEIEFFKKWLEIIKYEADEDEHGYNVKNLWLKSIVKREAEGKCIGELSVHHQDDNPQTGVTLISFRFEEERKKFVANFAEKDFVVIGTLKNPCIGFAFIEEIREESIVVSFERKISKHRVDKKYTIDKVSSHSAGMMQYVYLSNLMEDSPEASRWRRHLIMKVPPKFATLYIKDLSRDDKSVFVMHNTTQRAAMIKALVTDSILLVKGSPGCGKTTTIVGLIRLLVMRNKSVLVSAYTSNALDNILLGYKKYSESFIRIGSGGKLNEDILKDNSTNCIRSQAGSLENLRKLYDSKLVVGTTLLSLKHPIFKTRTFDYCIVDEGSQALPTVLMGALLQAKHFIVFGDPNQLAATIKSRKIKSMQIEDNIFSILTEPEFSCSLTVQYRMNQMVMKLGNKLLYDNQMKCGTAEQATDFVKIHLKSAKEYLRQNYTDLARNWLCVCLSRQAHRSVIFLDTERIGAFETVVASALQNDKEKDIVMELVKAFTHCKVPADDIGIIAPYRGQVHLIKESLKQKSLPVEVNTVDQYQGREKHVVIVSFTKSVPYTENENLSEESILNDVRRLNVAVTRARAKLILIGNSGTLSMYPACKKMLEILMENQIYKFSASDFVQGFFKD